MAIKKTRHKWQQLGHTLHHKKECTVCGCVKDTSIMMHTKYHINGQIYNYVPDCKPPQ